MLLQYAVGFVFPPRSPRKPRTAAQTATASEGQIQNPNDASVVKDGSDIPNGLPEGENPNSMTASKKE